MKHSDPPFDQLWKQIIEDLFPDFLRFFFDDADGSFDMKTFEFLDKEMEKLLPDEGLSRNRTFLDKLVKVKRIRGDSCCVLVHIEVQGYYDPSFPLRMFRSYYRLQDRYEGPITAIAIFTQKRPPREDGYFTEVLGTSVRYTYNACRIIDLPDEDMPAVKNTFALIVHAAKLAMTKGYTDDQLMKRYFWLYRTLAAKNIPKKKIYGMLVFLGKCIHFADPANYTKFEKQVESITNINPMGVADYLIEQGITRGRKIGRQEGIKKGEAQGIKIGEAQGIKKGEAQGIKKGEAQGIKKGEAQGIKKGEAQGIKKTRDESALAMLKKGYTTTEISEVLNLSRSYILSLKKKFRTSLINEQN